MMFVLSLKKLRKGPTTYIKSEKMKAYENQVFPKTMKTAFSSEEHNYASKLLILKECNLT